MIKLKLKNLNKNFLFLLLCTLNLLPELTFWIVRRFYDDYFTFYTQRFPYLIATSLILMITFFAVAIYGFPLIFKRKWHEDKAEIDTSDYSFVDIALICILLPLGAFIVLSVVTYFIEKSNLQNALDSGIFVNFISSTMFFLYLWVRFCPLIFVFQLLQPSNKRLIRILFGINAIFLPFAIIFYISTIFFTHSSWDCQDKCIAEFGFIDDCYNICNS